MLVPLTALIVSCLAAAGFSTKKNKKPIKTCRHFDAEQVVLQTHTFSC